MRFFAHLIEKFVQGVLNSIHGKTSNLADFFPLLEIKFRTPKTAVDSSPLSGGQVVCSHTVRYGMVRHAVRHMCVPEF